MNILSSALGHYEPMGDPADADCLIGHSFGTVIDPDSVNRLLADFALQQADGRPIIADRMLVNAFPGRDEQVAHVVEGPISNARGQGVGAWGTLVSAFGYMKREGLKLPLMFAQGHHIGRVVMQSKKLGVVPIVPEGLPSQYDADSEQFWTRSQGMWVPCEVAGSVRLWLRGQL